MDNPLFAGTEREGTGWAGWAEVRRRRLARYAEILRAAMHDRKLDEAAVVRRSGLPPQLVRDALAGRAAPPANAQWALAEAVGDEAERIAEEVAASVPPPRAAASAKKEGKPSPEPPAQPLSGEPPDPGPSARTLPDGRVELRFHGPLALPRHIAEAILALVRGARG